MPDEDIVFTQYTSVTEVLKALPHNLVIISIILAVVPFLLYRYRKKLFLLGVYITAFIQILSSWMERTPGSRARQAMGEYNSKAGFKDYLMTGIITILFILVATQNIHLAVVTSESMRPDINRGDLVIVDKLSKNFSLGDIIEIQPPGYSGTYVHRVVEKLSKTSWKTKGDNWKWEDSWTVTPNIVKGKVITINEKAVVLPRLGIYIMPTKNVALSQDPLYNLIINFIAALRSTMIVPILIIILLLLMRRS